jgi:ParB family transcriptional regulator, chromosome partitioning protein
MSTKKNQREAPATSPGLPPVVPKGVHVDLTPAQLKPNPNNPRRLFDPAPLKDLKESIKTHGILVPLTVYKLTAQNKYAILDGERRYRCCLELAEEGIAVSIPANVVEPPDQVASLVYMFNIHAFREQWELMPTALSLKQLAERLGHSDLNKLQSHFDELHELTGLSYAQLERCRRILSFPDIFQKLSLEVDPAKRIPSNFWIELYPVIELVNTYTPDLMKGLGRDGITARMVEKYRARKIRSVVHFRRVSEAFDVAEDPADIEEVADRLREFILDIDLETRAAFDSLIRDSRRFQTALAAAERFLKDVTKAKVDNTLEGKDELIAKLTEVLVFINNLLDKLSGEDPPQESDEDDLAD